MCVYNCISYILFHLPCSYNQSEVILSVMSEYFKGEEKKIHHNRKLLGKKKKTMKNQSNL